MFPALLGTLALVVVAEIGDKTQLLVAVLATRYRPWQVMAGVVIGSMAIHGISAAAGGVVGELIPKTTIDLAAAALFIGFGVWAILSASRDDEDEGPAKRSRWPVAGIAATFFLAELGDKTQLVALSRAAQATGDIGPTATFWAVWIGATAGMVIADGLAVLVGARLLSRVPRSTLARVSGVAFLLVGTYTLLTVLL